MPESSEYVRGRNERERRRLALQAVVLNPLTERLLQRAGIGPGMSVLEFGCGVGDVSLIAARLTGPTGHVTALDLDEQALDVARARASAEGIGWIEFRRADLNEFEADAAFDAAIGRYILVHTKDPFEIVKKAFAALRSGGVAAFHESDFSVAHPSYPTLTARDDSFDRIRRFMIKATHANIGTQLCHLFLSAGFLKPDCLGEIVLDSGPDSPFYEWFAETIRSMLPRMIAAGVIAPNEFDIDTLAERLRSEAASKMACMPSPLVIGCFARKP
ncbi:MAG TPA: methyltransferase domain-containing protein [Bryobacteraceae bacterium]|jgi:ubiquinone/menaquinone biosynthesis C-methylase UbiE